MRKIGFGLALCALAVGGCANFNSIGRLKPFPKDKEGQVFTVDAKQRHLIMSRAKEDEIKVCAEAAPDVFSAYATSVAAEGNRSGGQFGLSSNETAATIERTQTINMLRESFYRTCERYLSGAINKAQFVVQAARDQRSMVAVLAIEQLTGVSRATSTIISPGGTASSIISGGDAAKLVRDYDERLQKAKAAREEADKALAAAADKECSTDKNNKDADANKCTALKLAASQAKADEETANKAMDNITSIAKDLISGATASTTLAGLKQGGGGEFDNAARAASVSQAIVKIVELSTIDEPLMFCLAHLSSPTDTLVQSSSEVTKGCMSILISRSNADLKLRGGTGLDLETVNAFNRAIDANESAEDFLAEFERLIAPIPDDQLSKRVAAFEEIAKPISSIANSCGEKTDCLEAARLAWKIDLGLRLIDYSKGLSALQSSGASQ